MAVGSELLQQLHYLQKKDGERELAASAMRLSRAKSDCCWAWLPFTSIAQPTEPTAKQWSMILVRRDERHEEVLKMSWRKAGRLRRAVSSEQERRLAPILPEKRIELERLGSVSSDEAWYREASDLLTDAEKALAAGVDPMHAWGSYLASQRASSAAFDVPAIRAKALELDREAAEKIPSWRGETIRQLLRVPLEVSPLASDDQQRAIQEARAVLQHAWEIRDETMQDRYFKLDELKRQLLSIGMILLAAIVAIIFLEKVSRVDLSAAAAASDPSSWAFAILFGAVGGSISAFRSISRQRTKVKIPDQLTQSATAIFRPIIGGASALGVTMLLMAGIVTVASNTAAAVFGVAFVAGFSERFVTSAV